MFRRLKQRLLKNRTPAKTVELRVDTVEGITEVYSVLTGQTLLKAIRENGGMVSSYCGGMCSCGTCVVKIVAGNPKEANNREIATLGFSNHQNHERLACQLMIDNNLHVALIDRY